MADSIADIRKNYSQKTLLEAEVAGDPITQFRSWWEEAIAAAIDEVNAMTLATSSADGMPSARIVLLKGITEDGFKFYTNYESFKAKQLSENPKACLVFFWKELERQVRITGLVSRVSAQDSDEYFNSRPFGSRVGAVASPQSMVLANREWLDDQYKMIEQESQGTAITRPDHWGGYIVKPVIVEFWQGRSSRMHDRLQYTMAEGGQWAIERLAP
jgi:pyridoxamine 5'-phosphate oxidase